ncbi:MAG: hypothetical protein QNJ53_08380 [Pleurocapsa sp. MO_192.B19]|nr:hypothetical protein [Pleurocapsa sp. MO_192.B19]
MSIRSYLRYFTAIAIALSLQLEVKAQIEQKIEQNISVDAPSKSLRDRLSSEWENAVLTQTLESSEQINTLKFSPNGKLLASVGASQITIWQVDNGQIERILPGHHATELKMEIAPTAIAFSPNSRFLATTTWSQGLLTPDKSIVVWDTTKGKEVLSIKEQDGCRQILFDVEGKVIYGACGLGVTTWSFPEGEKLFSFATESSLEAIALSPDGQVIATVVANVTEEEQGKQSNKIKLWQLNQGKATLLNTLAGHDNGIAQLEFTSDGKRLVSSSYDGKINVWDWQKGQTYRNTNNLYSKNGLFSLSANSRLIAGNFHSSTMTNLITGLPLKNVMSLPHKGQTNQEINTIAFSPQEQLFARVEKPKESDNSLIYLWQTNIPQPEKLPSKRDNYLSIPITEYWGDREQLGTGETVKLKTSNPSSIGKDPKALALSALGLAETVESEQEQVELDYPRDNLATVSITQTNLADDSVAGIRYLVEFAPYGDRSNQQWQVIWAGQKFKCQANRGHQDWGTNLCQ